MNIIKSFFDNSFTTPEFLKEKQQARRRLLKSAAGVSALTILPTWTVTASQQEQLNSLLKTDPWRTLDSVMNHLLPASKTGPSAVEIKAMEFLYNLVFERPTPQDEIDFIFKGVDWLNGYTTQQLNRSFVALTFDEKEAMLRDISQSNAGSNWINMMLTNLLEAMLSPPSYGGNPNGIGWQWLEHKAGFPLPEKGQRYFELPKRASIIHLTRLSEENT